MRTLRSNPVTTCNATNRQPRYTRKYDGPDGHILEMVRGRKNLTPEEILLPIIGPGLLHHRDSNGIILENAASPTRRRFHWWERPSLRGRHASRKGFFWQGAGRLRLAAVS